MSCIDLKYEHAKTLATQGDTYGKTFVMDYEGYTFVFLSKYKQDFSLKCDLYYAFTFQP